MLRDILTLRAEKASLLGFKDWADYITADKMMQGGAARAEFIEKVWKLARAARRAGLRRAAAPAADAIDPAATEVADWQKVVAREPRSRSERYEVDASEVRQYFPYDKRARRPARDHVARSSTSRTSRSTRRARRGTPTSTCSTSCAATHKLGRIYLDMHPREGKYKHAAQFPLKDGVRGVQLPEGVLVCNFPEPAARARR